MTGGRVCHELDIELRPSEDKFTVLAPGGAGEFVDEMPRVRDDVVPPRIGGKPERLHVVQPSHGHIAT